ncbi:type I secretion system permease/ATPase [Sulfurisoma sediminicola]|uniref:ATP-binding cassette subfamily C exporter for protease/lipase/ATP-binding cassette subfamily C protein EexD n=1 Tax=Sulfurisoma sediminicola TaxID=1381557 RepID=A0A497XJQ2_9PROT|nr:type I secretion system permease/ATPase [Sulfurisoma sediminicola]RLJ67617.1 ATP-binding cassette subfamily C exporter for protease/lipase/ATP-binding cassette subfamily C protein EexD [Sulfurisoma sediminicola]
MREYLKRCRFFFVHTGILSVFINLFYLGFPLYFLQIFDRVVASHSVETLVMLVIFVVWVLLFTSIFEFHRGTLLTRAGTTLEDLLAGPVLKRQLEQRIRPAGGKDEDYLGDLAKLRSFLSGSAVIAFFDLPWGILFLVILFVMHPALGGVTLLAAVILGVLAFYEERMTRQPLLEASMAQRRTNRFASDAQRNAEAAGAMGMTGALSRRWQELNGRLRMLHLQTGHTVRVLSATSAFVNHAMRALVIATVAYLMINGAASLGLIVAGSIIYSRVLGPIVGIIHGWRNLAVARIAYERLNRLFGDKANESEKLVLPEPVGCVEVERVYFRFGQAEPLLRNLSFTLQPGESLGIIGPSGTGKTTLVRLLTGLWPTSSGAVRLDAAEMHSWDKDTLGRHLGYLPQDVELFDGTVAENICRMQDVALHTDAIVAAARFAHAHELILHLPHGYDTHIGDGGLRLSGGQKQRIAMARALFGSPRLIVLDEPTSNLDAAGETAYLEVVRDIRKAGITVITVTHKVSLLAGFDKILMLRDDASYRFGHTREMLPQMEVQEWKALPAPGEVAGPRPPTKSQQKPARKIEPRGLVGKLDDREVKGWVFFPAQPELVPTLEIYLDDDLLGTTEANLFRGDLVKHNIGTGYHGFEFRYPPSLELAAADLDRINIMVILPGGDKTPLPRG